MSTPDDQAEAQPVRRPIVILRAPLCERSFMIHYRGDEPVELVIDGQAYRVKRLAIGGRGTGVRDGDELLEVVRTVPRD